MARSLTSCRPGALRDLGELLEGSRPSVVVLMTAGHSYERCGAAQVVEPLLAGRTVHRLSGIASNPSLDAVVGAIELLRRAEPDVVLAVGGGSVLDLAKAARGLLHVDDVRAAVTSDAVPDPPRSPPLVAIPTTAGTGSEATHFSVVYVDGVKYSVGHAAFRPDHVLLDPQLTASLPPRATAETGLDAFAQAMESLWSTRSTAASRADARRALELAWQNLELAVTTGSIESRTAMCEAAHLAGRAIDVSRTTAAHALSYAITVRHGVAHGHAVALTLGPLLEHNGGVTDEDCVDPRGPAFVRERVGEVLEVIGAGDGTEGKVAVRSLLERLGLETTLGALGVSSPEDRRAIVASVDPVRQANNPRALRPPDLAALVEEVA